MATSAKETWEMHADYDDIFQELSASVALFCYRLKMAHIHTKSCPITWHTPRAIKKGIRVPTTTQNNCATSSGGDTGVMQQLCFST